MESFQLKDQFLKKLSEDGINAGKQGCQSKEKWIIFGTLFFMKDCFHLKLFWISYQREYTEVIVKKETWTLKKNIISSWNLVFPQKHPEDRINGCGKERGLNVEY